MLCLSSRNLGGARQLPMYNNRQNKDSLRHDGFEIECESHA